MCCVLGLSYDSHIADKELRGVIFFAVCRGKVSEGLNFADRAGRAVVITGALRILRHSLLCP